MTIKILPVIHHIDRHTSLGQVEVAKRCGADGIFLISHHGNDDELVMVAAEAKKAHPDFQIGINLLTRPPLDAAHLARNNGLDMVWADDMGVDSKGCTQEAKTLASFAVANPCVQLFASVAFKYRPHEPDPLAAAANALNLGFWPTTSGNGTGYAPDVEKIASMSGATEGILSIASGMTPENVGLYAPYLSHILVSTGISLDEHRLDEGKLKDLIAAAKHAVEEIERDEAGKESPGSHSALVGISETFAKAAALPAGNLNGMKISLTGVIAHGQRALTEMLVPFDDAPAHITEQYEDRLVEHQPGMHAYQLEVLGTHLQMLKQAFKDGDATTVRQFFDLYVID